MAEPAPTRRSSRIPTPPAQASSETLGASRAELRRRAAASATERPTVVLGTPVDEKRKDAAADAPVAVQPLTDLPAAPAPAAIELPAPVEPLVAPLSRRARRAPAPMIESVLTPAEPFELLEPVVAPEASDEVVVLETVELVAERPVRRQRAPRRPIDQAPADEAPVEVEPAAASFDEAVRPSQAEDAASAVDEFEAAARLFSFTGEFAVQSDAETAEAAVEDEILEAETGDEKRAAAHQAPRKRRTSRGTAFKRVTAASFSVGVMGIVGLMTVSMTTPAEAVAAANGADASVMSVVAPGDTTSIDLSPDEIQAYVAPATVQAETLDRTGSYDTTTVAELAGQAGIRNFSSLFHNDPNAPIQWPFVVGVTMSYGFGMRDGKLHKGIDFTPGAGSPIQAIADGTVRVASEAGGDYGVHVIIDHIIDGQLISSHYAHMQYGSLQVVAGQKVTVGTVLGHTGNTGRSYGAHTHFELLQNGTVPIDPMPWLREHAGG
ncbi:M23 family metallopeptidase [Microbacterium sp. SSM24]|uniref:M23 family metallopeptidase n=1 Tax=Microbacterium sp. SSM24 TaxID=2991714 RepID=UPI0022277E49|nr:peptidoglycan DD-metalloendopeptidase family protein [Microbacterium sp. SSM24]MCW3493583.1 peptidoglycan DD-metalloendopeptidase family protein [Microbacterium sp. SSM24]